MRNKRLCFSIITLLLLALVFNGAFAQLSEGGTPPGFKFAPASNLRVEEMPPVDVKALIQEDSVDNLYKDRPYRFGYNHLVNFSLDNSGTWTNLSNGSRIWQLDVKSEGAVSINLAFSNFYLPPGAKLFVYSKDHSQVLGAFSSKNNIPDKFLGTELIHGNEVIVEYFEPKDVRGQGTFILFRVTHGYKDLGNVFRSFEAAGACINNINCPQYSEFTNQKRAVVCIISGSNAICSGALINDNLNDGTPYVLTANHCGTVDGTWIFRFNWEAPGCSNPASSPPFQSIAQGTPVANSNISDFNLVKMSQIPPADFHVFYAGWNRSEIPATSVTVIHHPSGDIKKCSRADNPVTEATFDLGFTYGVALVWRIGQWTDGVTEPGSSGSPLFDENKHIVGQLSGGPSHCGASNSDLRDYFGKFCVSWDSGATPDTRLRDWLDPDSTNALTNNGYDPTPAMYTFDVALTGIAAPADSSCSDVVNPIVIVQNLGSKTVYQLAIRYHIDSNPDSVFMYQADSLVYFQSTFINLSGLQTTAGNHVFYASVSLTNDSVDQNYSNDSSNKQFVVINRIGLPAPLNEGFEGNILPPTGWTITTPAISHVTWQRDTVGSYGLSSHSVSVNEFAPDSTTAGEKPELITPLVDMTNIAVPSYLKFDYAYVKYDSIYFDSLAVLVSIDCGANWTKIYSKGGAQFSTGPDQTVAFIPTSSQWRTDTINISSFAGQATVQFAFQLISGYGNITYIDNIDIADTSKLLGVLTLEDNLLVRVFPNPFTQSVTVQINLAETESVDMCLYSLEGKLLKRIINKAIMNTGMHQVEINTDELSAGIYLLNINNRFIKLVKE